MFTTSNHALAWVLAGNRYLQLQLFSVSTRNDPVIRPNQVRCTRTRGFISTDRRYHSEVDKSLCRAVGGVSGPTDSDPRCSPISYRCTLESLPSQSPEPSHCHRTHALNATEHAKSLMPIHIRKRAVTRWLSNAIGPCTIIRSLQSAR